MKRGDMQTRVKLYRIKSPQGPHHIFNPGPDDVELIHEVWAKHEDKATSGQWAMVTQNTIIRKQFIINHRQDLPEDMAVGHRGQIYTVLAKSDLGDDKKWTMLLAGRLGTVEGGTEIYGI